MEINDVIIVGGGLSGLLVSHGLVEWSSSIVETYQWKILEARAVLGGRLANNNNSNADGSHVGDGQCSDGKIDMGGAWIWPSHQPNVRALVEKLNLPTFPQPDDPSSTRVDGGAVQFIRTLESEILKKHQNQERQHFSSQAKEGESLAMSEEAERMKESLIQLNTPVVSCTLEKINKDPKAAGGMDDSVVRLETATNKTFWARRVVFAVPPRILYQHVTFDPPLSQSKQVALRSSHTWMAGVTKVALVYSNRFWDLEYSNMGLPQQQQQHAPAFQVYDSSTSDGSVTALTFFTLVRPDNTQALSNDKTLADQVTAQMAQVWTYLGKPEWAKQVMSYNKYYIHRWPAEPFISEEDKPERIHPHPQPMLPLSEPEWHGLLHFAGSEMDLRSPGVMEGAVGSAMRVLHSLQQSVATWCKPST